MTAYQGDSCIQFPTQQRPLIYWVWAKERTLCLVHEEERHHADLHVWNHVH